MVLIDRAAVAPDRPMRWFALAFAEINWYGRSRNGTIRDGFELILKSSDWLWRSLTVMYVTGFEATWKDRFDSCRADRILPEIDQGRLLLEANRKNAEPTDQPLM